MSRLRKIIADDKNKYPQSFVQDMRYFLMAYGTFGGRTFAGNNEYAKAFSGLNDALNAVETGKVATEEQSEAITIAYLQLKRFVYTNNGKDEFESVTSFANVEKDINDAGISTENVNESTPNSIKVIESNPDNGQVIWSSLNKQGNGVFVSYNPEAKQFFCFQNFDQEGLENPDETVRLNKKSLKDQFEAAKRKACKMTSLNISPTHGFVEKQIIPLDNFIVKKKKRQDEEETEAAPGSYIPSIEDIITRYVPEQREEGEAAGHIYGIYYNKKMNTLMAMNVDANGTTVAQEQIDPENQQDAFNKAEEAIIKTMDDDAQWYRRDAENTPQDFGLQIDINNSPWQQFNEKQIKEQEKAKEEKQKQEEQNRQEDQEDEEKLQDEEQQSDENPEQDESQEQDEAPVIDETQENPTDDKSKDTNDKSKDTNDKAKDTKNKDNEHLYSTNVKTIAILFEGKNSATINEFAASLNKDKLILGFDILPGYTYKQSSYSLSRILTALNLFKCRVNQGKMNKKAGLSKTACFIRKTRLRKFAYNYVSILKELATDLVTDTQGIDVASIYFTKDTEEATDNSACGFIVACNGKYVAFGPNVSDDIVTIDTACIEEIRAADPAADVNSPKIDMNNFVARAESMNLPSLKVFGSTEEAERWINETNGNNIKGRVILNHKQEFEENDMWNNIDELGENPDITSDDIQNDNANDDTTENDDKEEKPKSEQDKWNELSDDEKTWQLRITYKNWPQAITKIRDWLDANASIIKNRSKINI